MDFRIPGVRGSRLDLINPFMTPATGLSDYGTTGAQDYGTTDYWAGGWAISAQMLIPFTPVASFSRNRPELCEPPSPTKFGKPPSASSGGSSETPIHRGRFAGATPM